MKKQNIKVGDRVMAVDNINDHKTPAPGTVSEIYPTEGGPREGKYDYRVMYDDDYCLLWSNVVSLIKPEKQPVIVITSDGKTTTAIKRLGKKVLDTASARCNDDDEFSFDVGASIALARLVGAEIQFGSGEKKVSEPNPRKVVCIESKGRCSQKNFTVGKIYERIRNHVLGDLGGIPYVTTNEGIPNGFEIGFGGEDYARFVYLKEED